MSKKVSEIYEEYKIMPNLREHQLRVAAVASLICDSLNMGVKKEDIVTACIFHDMGNIIKSNLEIFPEFLEPKGLAYWGEVKENFILKYGSNEHVATEQIAKEIGLTEYCVSLINNIGFSKAETNETQEFFEDKICNYADMRVGPHGILSVVERVNDGRNRNIGTRKTIASARFEDLVKSILNIETQIFANSNIKPEEITDESIAPVMASLRDFVVKN